MYAQSRGKFHAPQAHVSRRQTCTLRHKALRIHAMSLAVLSSPTRPQKAVPVACTMCNGTGKMATEWDCATGAVVALACCVSCLGRGVVLANARDAG